MNTQVPVQREGSVLGRKRPCVPCTCTRITLKPSEWQQSDNQVIIKNTAELGISWCSVLWSLYSYLCIFIQDYCGVLICWLLQRTEAAFCHMGHFHLHRTVNNQNILSWTMEHIPKIYDRELWWSSYYMGYHVTKWSNYATLFDETVNPGSYLVVLYKNFMPH
jgi:hypothetical protein